MTTISSADATALANVLCDMWKLAAEALPSPDDARLTKLSIVSDAHPANQVLLVDLANATLVVKMSPDRAAANNASLYNACARLVLGDDGDGDPEMHGKSATFTSVAYDPLNGVVSVGVRREATLNYAAAVVHVFDSSRFRRFLAIALRCACTLDDVVNDGSVTLRALV